MGELAADALDGVLADIEIADDISHPIHGPEDEAGRGYYGRIATDMADAHIPAYASSDARMLHNLIHGLQGYGGETPETLEADTRYCEAALSYTSDPRSRCQVGCGSTYSRAHDNFIRACRNRLKTMEFLEGFRVFYADRGFLSDKQKTILRTNYIGGADKFMLDCQSHSEKMREVFKNHVRALKAVIKKFG